MKRNKQYYKRSTGKVQVSLLLPEELVKKLQALADKEHRSRNQQAEMIIENYVDELTPK